MIPNTSGRVWQVVSEGNNPVVLTTSLKANKLIYNVSNQSYTAKQASNSSFYQIASLEGDFSAGITQNNDLISLEGSSIFNNEVEDVAVSSKHGLFLVAKNDGTKGYDLWGWGKNERGEIVSTEKDSAGNDRLTEYTTPVKVSCSLKSPTGATSGSVSPMNDYKTIKEYFSGTYNYPPNNSGSACDITNPYRAGEVERHLGSNIDRCTCALCLDVWDLHRQNTNLYTTLKISEPQNITNLQLMLDRDGCSSIMHNLPEEKTGNKIQKQVRKSRQVPYTDWWGRTRYRTEYYYEWEWVDETVPTLYTKCTLTKLDSNGNATNQGVSFIAKNAIKTNESIVTPLGTVYSLDFDNFLQTAYDRSGKNIISSNGYEIQNGNYRIRWEYSKNLGSTYSEFAQDALFWGINPKAISEEELKRKKAGSSYGGGGYYGGSTQLSLTQDQLFGSIFRLNSNMFNLRGGIEYDDEVPTYYALAAGENFSLAIILTKTDIDSGNRENYRIIGWGDNKYNQLGIGVASNSVKMTILPIQPDIVKSYRDMKAGQYHTLFLTNTGKVYSWGGGVAKEDPHPIEGLSDIVYISAGNDYSSAIDKAGNIYSWNVNNETSLTKIAGGEAFSQ